MATRIMGGTPNKKKYKKYATGIVAKMVDPIGWWKVEGLTFKPKFVVAYCSNEHFVIMNGDDAIPDRSIYANGLKTNMYTAFESSFNNDGFNIFTNNVTAGLPYKWQAYGE